MTQINPAELRPLLANEDIFLLDVRESFEHEEFNIGGTLIPLGDLMQRATEIPTDKTVIVYCRKGIRSQIAIQRLQDKLGLNNLVNLQGGMESWKREIGF